ncbi:uncharacterized protein LOC113318015 [Papaver somniferum]|uniref:uncharacterized protein LOC113318015 n=1 Tax=Papaver somniferum TaxID=3469 RepID=UPI000E6FEB2B|nr:uncharacterized protein LOC113318015 [Papaver somniferum]
MEVADMDEIYPREFTEMELLSQKIYCLGRYQAAVIEKLEGEFIRPRRQVTAWMNFVSTEIKDILAMERRLCDENSEESLGLLQSVVQQMKTMKKYIVEHMEPNPVYSDSDSVSDSTQKSSISLAEEEDEYLDCKLISSYFFEENENSTVLDSHEQKHFPNWSIMMDTFQIKNVPDKYDRNFVQELLYKHGYWSDSLPSGVTTAAWCMFDKKLETAGWNSSGIRKYSLSQRKIDKVSYKLIVDECLLLILDSFRMIFDRGKGGKLIKGYLLIDSDYRFCFEVFTSVSFVLNVGSVSMAYDKEKFVHELLTKHGFEADSWFRICMLANPMDILCFEHKFFFNHTVPTGIFVVIV